MLSIIAQIVQIFTKDNSFLLNAIIFLCLAIYSSVQGLHERVGETQNKQQDEPQTPPQRNLQGEIIAKGGIVADGFKPEFKVCDGVPVCTNANPKERKLTKQEIERLQEIAKETQIDPAKTLVVTAGTAANMSQNVAIFTNVLKIENALRRYYNKVHADAFILSILKDAEKLRKDIEKQTPFRS